MSSIPTAQDLARYEEVLIEIGARLDRADHLLKPSATPESCEAAALHLRKALELIVLGALVTNRAALMEATRALNKKNAEATRKLLNKSHPQYWPGPVRPQGNRLVGLMPGMPYLAETDWGRALGDMSAALHAGNPLARAPDWTHRANRLRQRRTEMHGLMSTHLIILLDRSDHIVVGRLADDDGRGHASLFAAVPS